jgi:hypothetical protein
LVVVDTEEEFDWNRDFSRDAVSVKALSRLDSLQRVFDEFEIRPVYVVDYPVVSQPGGGQALGPILEDGRAELGAHLHAWVNPPHEEPVNRRNSYQKNLDPRLELEKLRVLKASIDETFDTKVVVHKAGRYGIGVNTPVSLAELGFEIDISYVPGYDYSADGGPDFRDVNSELFRFGPANSLLGIPNTAAFIGRLSNLGPALYSSRHQSVRAVSLLSRALSRGKLLERIMLSPEGHALDKLIRLTQVLRSNGTSVFTFSLHSPTAMPGGTPYASSENDVLKFLEKCRRYFDYFLNNLGGQTLMPSALKAALAGASTPCNSSKLGKADS